MPLSWGMGYVKTHWRGQQPLNRSFWVNGVLLRLGAYGGLALLTWAQPLPKIFLFAAVAADLIVMIWQSVGYFRAAEHNLSGSSSMLPLWGGMVALIVAVAVMLSQWWGLVLAANAPPAEELYSVKMERMRAAQYVLTVDDARSAVTFKGDLTHGVTKRMAAILAENAGPSTVYLDSSGGNIFEARGLAKLITSARLDTHVEENCSSACTIVFIAGATRTADPDAQLGFHGYALMDAAKLPQFDIAEEQERDRLFFVQQGVSDEFAARIYNSPNRSIWFPARDELLRANVLTQESQRK
ncbi:hypothetical protein SAMN05444851_0300 [Aliiroseovarius sediminilitoris]|uniref:Clp protease n=2 Tax=Aliiroseovarius sediminilitoris TaxID=1173584 RepID=A0A1I0MSN3_9RHOB|nr:hypothetical protein SAMN05444851_0300 [Aliiroseovarius sediminilitoris]